MTLATREQKLNRYFLFLCFDRLAHLERSVGVAEKGYATLELSVNGTPGHSSIPPKTTPIGKLARAVGKLEANPQPNVFGSGPEADFFSTLAPFVRRPPILLLVFFITFPPSFLSCLLHDRQLRHVIVVCVFHQSSGAHRLIFGNLWLFSPLLKWILASQPDTDALQRTTTAITVFNGGYKVMGRDCGRL